MADAQLRAMYGHYVTTFWDVVIEYRRNIRPVGVNYLTAGLHGLAPYWFDVDALLSVTDRGKLSATMDIATDWLLWSIVRRYDRAIADAAASSR